MLRCFRHKARWLSEFLESCIPTSMQLTPLTPRELNGQLSVLPLLLRSFQQHPLVPSSTSSRSISTTASRTSSRGSTSKLISRPARPAPFGKPTDPSPAFSTKPATAVEYPSVLNQAVEFEGVVRKRETCHANIEVSPRFWQGMRPHFFHKSHSKVNSPFRRRRDSRTIRVCPCPPGVLLGQTCRVSGMYEWDDHIGLQIKHQSCKQVQPNTPEGVKHALTSVKNIGESRATELMDLLGYDRVLEVLDSDDAVAQLVAVGYGKAKKATNIKELWDNARKTQLLESFLPSLGLSASECAALKKEYGSVPECKEALHKDPYLALLRLRSINLSLKMADNIAAALGVREQHAALSNALTVVSSPSRGAVAMLEALMSRASNRGNTFERWSQLQREASAKLAAADEQLVASMTALRIRSPDSNSIAAEQSITEEEGEDAGELSEVEEAEPANTSTISTSTPLVWASILMGLQRMVMEVHTADPQQPPTTISLPSIDRSVRAQPELHLDRPGRQRLGFPFHAIVYLDLLHKAERDVADRLSTMLLEGTKMTLQAPLQALKGGHMPTTGGCTPAPSSTLFSALKKEDKAAVAETLRTLPELTDHQQLAVQLASHMPVMLLTGAAGCGKTYVTQAIVALWLRQKKRVKLCAPTGRAAQQLQERMGPIATAENELGASTIHRLLGYKSIARQEELLQQRQQADVDALPAVSAPQDDAAPSTALSSGAGGSGSTLLLDDFAFVYNKDNKLDVQAVLVDEASMVDVQLMAALLRALPKKCQLVMVGDPHQLLPVGSGCVLKDLIDTAAFPRVHLDEIFRQAKGSNIVLGAHEIKQGLSPTTKLPCLSLEQVRGLIHATQASLGPWASSSSHKGGAAGAAAAGAARSEAAINELRRVFGGDGIVLEMDGGCSQADVAGAVLEVMEGLGHLGVQLAEDVQVLSPTKKKGMLVGTEELNKRLQPIMNPLQQQPWPLPTSSDRRIQWRVRDRVIQTYNNYDADVYNGDLGTITSIFSDGSCSVEFSPRTGCEEPHLVNYASKDRFQLAPAWATTVHKAQGGQYPVVVIPLHTDIPTSLLNPKMLYTAVTRTQRLLILVAPTSVLDTATTSKKADAACNSLLAPRLVHALTGEEGMRVEGAVNGAPVLVLKDMLRSLVPTGVLPSPSSGSSSSSSSSSGAGGPRARLPRQAPPPAAAIFTAPSTRHGPPNKVEPAPPLPPQRPQQGATTARARALASPSPPPSSFSHAPWELAEVEAAWGGATSGSATHSSTSDGTSSASTPSSVHQRPKGGVGAASSRADRPATEEVSAAGSPEDHNLIVGGDVQQADTGVSQPPQHTRPMSAPRVQLPSQLRRQQRRLLRSR